MAKNLLVLHFHYQKYCHLQVDSNEITGMYGQSWEIGNIQKVTLLEEMPEVLSKENGFGLATISKGHFNVRSYGSSLLFVHKQSPYILIEMNQKPIFINGENPAQTQLWYEQLKKKME